MSLSTCKNLRLSSSVEKEVMVRGKQGIISVLGSDCERTRPIASLRRTLSADMSSKKWRSQHDFSSLKKILSSAEFPVAIADTASSSFSESEEENELRGQTEIWNSIQEEKKKKQKELENPAQSDIWSLILSQKTQDDSKTLPPPYVHPLVKRSASSLSEKSLEICTESLGSETGSDGFSSYQQSETGDADEDKEKQEQGEEEEVEEAATSKYEMEDWRVVGYDLAAASKKSSSKSFPPPLPSLASRGGCSVHMRPHRDNGRFVLEAVSVTSQNNFRAERQDGRLVLTFVDDLNKEDDKWRHEMMNEEKNDAQMFEVEMKNSIDEKENEDESEAEEEEDGSAKGGKSGGGGEGSGDVRFVMEEASKLCGAETNVHRLALMVNKPRILPSRNITWSNKFNDIVQIKAVEEVVNPIGRLAQSLPPRPPVARMIPVPSTEVGVATTTKAAEAKGSLNGYDYYWKAKPMDAVGMATAAAKSVGSSKSKDRNNTSVISKNTVANEKQELLILRGNKGDYLVPSSKGCKEPKRSLFIWEPHCIATS